MAFEVMIPKTIDSILNGIKFWKNSKKQVQEEIDNKASAIQLIKIAVINTKSYLYNSSQGSTSREDEQKLAEKWQEAAEAIWQYDRDLFYISEVKALGWADPREWTKREQTVSTVKLDDIINQCDFRLKELMQQR